LLTSNLFAPDLYRFESSLIIWLIYDEIVQFWSFKLICRRNKRYISNFLVSQFFVASSLLSTVCKGTGNLKISNSVVQYIRKHDSKYKNLSHKKWTNCSGLFKDIINWWKYMLQNITTGSNLTVANFQLFNLHSESQIYIQSYQNV
jgi:hypothetical protein